MIWPQGGAFCWLPLSPYPQTGRNVVRTPHHTERIVDPPDDDLSELADMLCASAPPGPCDLVVGGRKACLPEPLRAVLADMVSALARGESVALVSHEPTVSTQEAADLLGISRPTLVRLLERGEIAYDKPGSHRRVSLRDVVRYQRSHHHELHSDATLAADALSGAAPRARA
jgi:excisionase family DNA binding protein